MLLQRDEICKVGEAGQPDDGHIQRLDDIFHVQPLGEGILILNVHIQVGHHAQHGQARFFFQHGQARAQNFHIAAEFVDDESLNAGPLLRLQQLHSAVKLGEHAAPVDIACQQDGGIHQFGQPHVDNVVRLEVDLRRAAGALDDDDVHILRQAVVGS